MSVELEVSRNLAVKELVFQNGLGFFGRPVLLFPTGCQGCSNEVVNI